MKAKRTRWGVVLAMAVAVGLGALLLNGPGESPSPKSSTVSSDDLARPRTTSRVTGVIAGYLVNFAREVSWPNSNGLPADAPLRVGLVTTPEDRAAIESILQGKLVGMRPIQFASENDPEAFAACQLLFVAGSSEARLVADAFAGEPVLTVAYSPEGFSKTGCSIELVNKGENIRWVLNSGAMQAQGITPSTALYKLALEVRKGPVPAPPAKSKGTGTSTTEEGAS